MKKEEILERSRKSNMDERKEKIDNESYSIGMIAMLVLLVFYLFWRLAHNAETSDILSIMAVEGAAASFYKYKQVPDEKKYLFYGILSTISTAAFIAAFIIKEVILK